MLTTILVIDAMFHDRESCYFLHKNFIKVMDSDNRVTFEDTIDYFRDMYNGNSAKTYVAVRNWFLDNYPRHAEMIVETAPKLPAA